jgi:DNA-binding NarL/FixJ family response regulator
MARGVTNAVAEGVKSGIQKKANNGRLSVLVADDSAGMRQNLMDLLSGLPDFYAVKTARDGAEAMESVRLFKPDVLILDIHMPARSGLEVLQSIRKTKRVCTVIILTSLADDFYRKKCQELEADYFFDKLTEFDQFVTTLKTLKK